MVKSPSPVLLPQSRFESILSTAGQALPRKSFLLFLNDSSLPTLPAPARPAVQGSAWRSSSSWLKPTAVKSAPKAYQTKPVSGSNSRHRIRVVFFCFRFICRNKENEFASGTRRRFQKPLTCRGINLYKTFTEPFSPVYIFLLSSYHVTNQTPKGQPPCKPH